MLVHLHEVEDAAARDGVNTYQTQMEILVLSLLPDDRETALAQIEEARGVSLNYVMTVGTEFYPTHYDAKSGRVAIRMLKHTFDRLRLVTETPNGNGSSNGPTQ